MPQAVRLGSYKAWKLKNSQASRPSDLPASWLICYELICPKTNQGFEILAQRIFQPPDLLTNFASWLSSLQVACAYPLLENFFLPIAAKPINALPNSSIVADSFT
jgi:hypothetical protein